MKKVVNKYRNSNTNNTQYSLNYKFDSISTAGKVSGTALDLIKKYNELAKEAHSNGNYTEMENFRQYAEHYRKIVTDINEKKNAVKNTQEASKDAKNNDNNKDVQENIDIENQPQEQVNEKFSEPVKEKKNLKIVEIVKSDKDLSKKEPEKEITIKKRAVRRVKKVEPEE